MSNPTEDEVKQAYDIVSRMIAVEFQDFRDQGVSPDDDMAGLIEGKRQILRYAIRWFDGDVYARFTKDE